MFGRACERWNKCAAAVRCYRIVRKGKNIQMNRLLHWTCIFFSHFYSRIECVMLLCVSLLYGVVLYVSMWEHIWHFIFTFLSPARTHESTNSQWKHPRTVVFALIYYHIRALHTMRVENRNSLNGWKPVKAHTHTLSTENTKPQNRENFFYFKNKSLCVLSVLERVLHTHRQLQLCTAPINFHIMRSCTPLEMGFRWCQNHYNHFQWVLHTNTRKHWLLYSLSRLRSTHSRCVRVCVLSIQLFLKAIAAHTAIRSHYYASCTRTLHKNSAKQ